MQVLTVKAEGTFFTPDKYGYSRPDINCVYPFGFDPVWGLSDQLLSYTNNFKMKTAVIFAIIQMSIGIFLKGFNALHFRSYLDFFFEFIPQICLMLALFGWMDLLIVAKWLYPKNIEANFSHETDKANFNIVNKAPAIITTMIDMFLKTGDNHVMINGKEEEGYYYLIPGQRAIGIVLLIIAFASVPTMLYVKPLVLKRRIEADKHNHVESESHRIDYGQGASNDHYEQIRQIIKDQGENHGHHSFGDIFIH